MTKSKKKKRSDAAAARKSTLIIPLQTKDIKPISDEYEMLFLKKSTTSSIISSTDDFNISKSDEFETLEYKRMNADERRQYRRNTDLRLRHHVESLPSSEPQKTLCYPHSYGKCEQANNCLRSHEMRPQRYPKLCILMKANNGFCPSGSKCLYMHPNEFPCKQYYLGKYHDATKCRWMHSGPLSNEWRDILINYIITTQNQFGNEHTIRQQFDEQHRKLIKSEQIGINENISSKIASQSSTASAINVAASKQTAINAIEHNDIQCIEKIEDKDVFDDITLQQSPPFFYGFEDDSI